MLLALRGLSVVGAIAVAVLTLLPRRVELEYSVLAQGRAIGDELSGALAVTVFGLAALAVLWMLWKSRLASRLKMSWPFFALAALCLVGIAALVVSAYGLGVFALVSRRLGSWLHRLAAELDAEHAVTYAGFALVVGLAWRDKIALPWLGLGLFAFGFALELLQELVPKRQYRLGDLAANGIGVVVGMLAVVLYERLAGARVREPVRAHGHRRRRRSSRSAPRASAGSRRAGLITALAGLLVVMASVLAGSLAELRLAQVGWQILGLGTAYAFTFWLGVAVMGAGLLLLRGLGSRRGRSLRLP